MAISYLLSGSAVAGADYNSLPGAVLIPAGQASATITVTPVNDSLSEGTEIATFTLRAQTGYTVNSASAVTEVTIADNEPAPAPAGITSQFNASTRRLELSVKAGASSALLLEASSDLSLWQPWTTIITDSNGQAKLAETLQSPTPARLFFRAR